MSVTDQIWFTLSLGGVLIMFEGVATWAAYKINSRRSKDKKREYMEKASETAVKIPVGMALFFFFLFSSFHHHQ